MQDDTSPIDIRPAGPGDEALFERIADGVFDHAIDPKVLAAFLAAPGHHLVVALHDGTVIGQCAAMIHRHPDLRPTEIYIDELAVAPLFQRRGIARGMIEAMLALGKSLGCTEAWVSTKPDNRPARNLYASRRVAGQDFVMYEFDL